MNTPTSADRILLYKPCCIGDVVMTTALLSAVRRAHPTAHITWAVGTHSATAIAHHPAVDALLPTGSLANPAKSPIGLLRLANQIRRGGFDMALIPVRSPLAGLAVKLAGVPVRVGLDSAGRGRFHTIKAPLDPAARRHEADIYLDLARVLDIAVADCWVNVEVTPKQVNRLPQPVKTQNGLVVVHVGGGQNPGMTMTEKRPPIHLLANAAARAAAHLKTRIAILGGPDDRARADELHEALHGANPLSLVNILDFSQIMALGKVAALVIGPDTGLLHLMAAAGAPTMMIFGPSDPARYAPFVPPERAAYAWKPYPLPEGGVASGPPKDWTWEENGVTAKEVWVAIEQLLDRNERNRTQNQRAAGPTEQ